MARFTIDERGHSAAPREAVWAVLADVEHWDRWGDWSRIELERQGDDPPGGVGAIRTLPHFPFAAREEITAWERPSRMAYKLLGGMPLRDYSAEVTLADSADGGTDIRWRAEFAGSTIPAVGGLLRRGLAKFTADTIRRLARAAEG